MKRYHLHDLFDGHKTKDQTPFANIIGLDKSIANLPWLIKSTGDVVWAAPAQYPEMQTVYYVWYMMNETVGTWKPTDYQPGKFHIVTHHRSSALLNDCEYPCMDTFTQAVTTAHSINWLKGLYGAQAHTKD